MLAAKHTVRHAFALHILTFISCCGAIVGNFHLPVTSIQSTIEALFLTHPELEVTIFAVVVATKRCLRFAIILQLVYYLAIRDVADLMVLFHNESMAITRGIGVGANGHVVATGIVREADIAVDPFPAVFALARFAFTG